MPDPRELRNKRLENEHKELMRINGELIKIEPIGNAPHEKYKITFNIRTIIGHAPKYSNKTICTLTLPPGYPFAAPSVYAAKPYPCHPNWFSEGRWCYGSWNAEEPLVNFILRCARTLQHDPAISGRSTEGQRFWEENKRKHEMILSDTQVLSALDELESIVIHKREIPKIVITPKIDAPKITIIKADEPKITIIRKSTTEN